MGELQEIVQKNPKILELDKAEIVNLCRKVSDFEVERVLGWDLAGQNKIALDSVALAKVIKEYRQQSRDRNLVMYGALIAGVSTLLGAVIASIF